MGNKIWEAPDDPSRLPSINEIHERQGRPRLTSEEEAALEPGVQWTLEDEKASREHWIQTLNEINAKQGLPPLSAEKEAELRDLTPKTKPSPRFSACSLPWLNEPKA
jgi:hypothetical protein